MIYRAILILSLSLTLIQCVPHPSELRNYTFDQFVQEFQKSYENDQIRQYHEQIFKRNVDRIIAQNEDKSKSYLSTIHSESDLLPTPIQSNYKPLPVESENMFRSLSNFYPIMQNPDVIDLEKLPKHVDWRQKGVITAVKDQAKCGSCWAQTATELIESYVAINSGVLEELSVQQILDCAKNPLKCGGTGGCSGSVVQIAFNYVELFGLVKNSTIPYTAVESECSFNPETMKKAVEISGYYKLPRNDQKTVMWHLAHYGPLGVSVYANQGWKEYHSGVFDGCDYAQNIDMNHAVTLVGYGTDEALGDYWIIRNHWNTKWGENGYMRIKREKQVQCGWDKTVEHGSACQGDGVTEQYACGQCGILFESVYPIQAVALDDSKIAM